MPTEEAPDQRSRPAGDELSQVLRDYLDATRRLQQTHETLQREIVRLREELASKDQELERRRRLSALGELAAGVAHEVRNPLGAIQLYSGLLRSECRGREPALELIEKIEAGIRAIECVVQDTLALARRSCAPVARPLREIVERARDVCLSALQAHQVALAVECLDPDVCVPTDGDGLQRALVNLMANAAEASPVGGTVTVRIGPARDGQVELRLLDDGPGLPEEIKDRMFDPFFTTKPQGTGLGLTIALRLVEAHSGTLSAANRAGGGAEFVVTLPTGAAGDFQTQAAVPARNPSAA